MGIFDDIYNFKKGARKQIPYVYRGSLLFIQTVPLIDLWIERNLTKKKKRIWTHEMAREEIRRTSGFVSSHYAVRIKNKVYRCSAFFINEAPESMIKMFKNKKEEA